MGRVVVMEEEEGKADGRRPEFDHYVYIKLS